jgi:hypothetical protein
MTATQIIAYHGDPKIKAKYLRRLRAHRRADEIVQGVGWETNGTTKGCAVGCTLNAYDHSLYPIELGLPEWLALLEDSIFEGLQKDDALKWPTQFLSAIRPGANTQKAYHRICSRILREVAWPKDRHDDEWGCAIAVRRVANLHARSAAGSAAWSAARSAAWSAARSAAESAAWSAAGSAESAESAAGSAILILACSVWLEAARIAAIEPVVQSPQALAEGE